MWKGRKMMKKQPYEIIEDILIYLFGSIGIVLMFCIAGFVEGGNYIASALCLACFVISISISCFFWKRKEGIRWE